MIDKHGFEAIEKREKNASICILKIKKNVITYVVEERHR